MKDKASVYKAAMEYISTVYRESRDDVTSIYWAVIEYIAIGYIAGWRIKQALTKQV